MTKRQRKRIVFVVLGPLLALVACSFQETDLVGLPVEVPTANTQEVDVGAISESVQEQVHLVLPEAYLTAFDYVGPCQGLAELRGRLHMQFVQVEHYPLHKRVLVALTSVDTDQETLEIRTRDYSDRSWSTQAFPLAEVSIAGEIAGIASKRIEDLGLRDCDVSLSSVGRTWHTYCTKPGSGPTGALLCRFEIDAASGQIVTPNQ